MASLTETLTGLKNKNTDTTASAQQRYPVQFISYTCLEGSSYNFYPMVSFIMNAKGQNPSAFQI